ncbi:MAG: flagellar biosynthesis protein FlhA [Oscillospiraceae bacterium]|jgi:flagellar biosynthesis protein FlhA|nr:flagellar biosynthesis protein FlhA [Oscillospiraceae bacterium]
MQSDAMERKLKFGDVAIAVLVISVVLLIVIPLSTALIDALITVNLAAAAIILLIALNTREILEFSTFPSLLLITTIFRIAINISTTRKILGNHGDAGRLVATFGNFVTGGNLVVGVIIFLIIFLVQFIVIVKGSERVAEVAARFTLDAMPGKQMAIDADLNSGVIDENTARQRRVNVQRESDFYGAMDGASKFVKGDAILGIIITIINIVGGILIEVLGGGAAADAVNVYTVATIGDGLSSQIPALLISTATGILVTKANSDNSMGMDLTRQLSQQPTVLVMGGAVIGIMGLIPGMPVVFMLPFAGGLVALGLMLRSRLGRAEETEEGEEAREAAAEIRKPENVVALLSVDPIELEFGYGIIPLADASQGGDLLDRVVMIRRQCALDLGMIVPVIRLRDNIQFTANEYMIKIRGNEVARGEILLDHYLAMNPGDISEEVEGVDTREPAFGLPAKWVSEGARERAELLGYTLVDPPSVIATHLTEVVRRHADELLERQQVQVLADNLRQTQPALVDEVVPKLFSLGEVQKVLGNLLREGVSIRDMGTIVETLGDYGGVTRDPDMLTEYVRQALRRSISHRFAPERQIHVVTLDPALEHQILENVRQTEHGSYVALEPDVVQRMFDSLRAALERVTGLGFAPVVLTAPVVRYQFKKMVEGLAPDLVVLSYNELEQNIDIQADGVVAV